MKKFLTLCTALLLFGSMTVVQAVDYYVAGTMNGWDTKNDANKMSLVSGTIYSKTFTAMGTTSYEFKISTYDWGQSWGGNEKDNTQSNVTLSGSGNISFTLSTTSDVTFYFDAGSTKKIYVQANPVVVPSYTFTSGTTIYYDFRTYGAGVNLYNSVWNNEWKSDVSSIISITLSSAWEVTASSSLFKSAASDNWQIVKCTTLPTEGQNMIVSTDGKTYHWDTYVPPVDPTVDFVSLGSTIGLGLTANFAATSTNVDNPVYTFYVKKGSAAYGSAVTSYTFAEAGTYTVKVEVNGDDSKHAENTQEVTVVDGAHIIYYVKENAWAQVNAHMWGADPSTSWPGALMTLTASETEKHHYPVYAVTFTPNYVSIIFSNDGSNQSSDLDITYSTPYYYNGQWYATLAECDPITVSLSGLDNGYLVGANATISATSNLTYPSYTYQVKVGEGDFAALEDNPYIFAATGNYTFKVTATGVEGSKTATQTVMVYEPLTIYFVNKEGWENVNAYFYTPEKTGWPGDPMSLTEATTAKHSYKVYSATIGAGAHANVIFNNGSAQTSDLTINAAKPYYYDGEWYATLAEIDPATYVDFDGVAATVLVNTPLTLAATSNVTNPTYNYYVKPAVGDYAAITSPHTFTAAGIYTLKVEALENGEGEPVASRTKDIEVYATHTFTAGTRIYVDFTAMTEGSKKVNYPFGHVATADPLDYDENGAGTFKTIRFSEDVEWSTLSDFIKTEKAGWTGLKFTVPGEGQNKIIVAADGASYTWGTYTPTTAKVKFFAPRTENNPWDQVFAYAWDAAGQLSIDWPGDEITSTKNSGWYEYDVPVGASIIFSDHNTVKGEMKTADITNITADACYVSTAIDYEASPKKVTVTEQCTVDYYLAGMLEAEEVNWPAANPDYKLDANNQIVFQNLAVGTYEFKITNGTWAWSIGGNDHLMSGDCSAIAETAGIGNVAFSIDHAQDVTITYYPETEKICLGAQTVLEPALAWNTTFASARIGAENTLPWLNHNLTSGVVYTSSNPSVASFADASAYNLTLNAAGTTTITANYYGNVASYKLDVYDFAVPAKSIETIGGKFIINAKGDTAVFSRGNLQYDYGQNQWYCAEKQYNVLSDINLHFGDENYKGVIDLFGWSNAVSNYGRLASNKDADFPGYDDFVDWGNVFSGDEKEWSTLSKDEWNYLMAHNKWTMIQLNQNLVSTWENGFLCMVLFPIDWEAPAELASLNYKFYDFDNEEKAAQNTFTIAQWESLFEAYGAVLLPPAGARAGCVGNTWNGDAEATKGWNADAGGWYDHVDNVGWYGYYWTGTQDTRSNYQHCASYLILPGWSEGPTLADEDDLYMPPQVWSREKRRGNSVRLVTRIPKRYTVTYAAGGAEGDVPTDTKKYLPNDNVVLAGQGALAKDGFTFAGWNDGNATYEAGAGYTMPEQDVIFTAQWDEIVPSYVEVRSGLEADRYYTVCLEKNITDFKGATFWNMTYKDQDEATIVYIVEETAPEAGKPYIIQATNDNEGKLEVIYGDEVAATPVENGALRGTFENINADDFAALEGTVYLLINNAIRPRTTGNYLTAHRAYIRYDLLTVPQMQNFAPGRRVKSMPLQPKVATGMEQAEISDKPAKAIIEGQLFILRGEKMYDATGRQVK